MMPDMLAGRIDMGISAYGTVKSFLVSGAARPILVSSATRIPELPDTPTGIEART